jgi:predicted lysophospholipase L1 biosynthesis ABC-type transport system permease subunit
VLVSENLARELWGSSELALHRKVRSFPGEPWREIVGVVEDVHDDGLNRAASKVVYWPALMDAFGGDVQFAARTLTFIVRSRQAGSAAFVEDAARAVVSVNGNLPVTQVRTLDDLYRQSLARTSFTLLMLAIAAVIALLLAVVGLYAVVAYAVTRRTREIGIRVALGAHTRAVRMLFVRDATRLAATGAVIGAATAVAATRWMTTLLFGVSPLDPATYAIVAVTLVGVAAVAASFPAHRAASIAPLDAIREE